MYFFRLIFPIKIKSFAKLLKILIKIQKDNESLEDAINLLYRAALSKNSKKSFLIRTNDTKSLFDYDNRPSMIEIIDAVNFRINDALI